MKRGKDRKSSIPHSCVDFTAAVLGASASAPTVPLNGSFTPTTATYPARANGVSTVAAEAPTRTSAGLYVITVMHQLPNILFPSASVVSAGASPTACLVADVTIANSAKRQITVQVSTPAGVATDLGTSDMLLLYIHGQDSGA